MTRTQYKKAVKELLDKLEALKAEFDDLAYEAQDEADGMEPYEGKEELTAQQEERQEWLSDLSSALTEIAELDTCELDDMIS